MRETQQELDNGPRMRERGGSTFGNGWRQQVAWCMILYHTMLLLISPHVTCLSMNIKKGIWVVPFYVPHEL
jgi:hypothetical protein